MGGLEAYTGLLASARARRIGDGGADTCAALTAALDAAIAELAADVADEPVAVVAVGGYGRAEQCIGSDVDVMLLHDGADLERITHAVLYPLWDARLKVGHSVRTVKEALDTARTSFETLTSLLTMRRVAGDDALVVDLERGLAGLLKGRPLAATLATHERERRDLEPYPVMAADLKEGRGGLRTFQGLAWERRRAELLWDRDDAPPVDAAETQAYASLLAVRNALHAVAGRAVDEFHVDLRAPAAHWLGVDMPELASMVCEALRLGDRLAERRWPDLLPGQDPMVAMGRSVFGRITSRFRSRPEPVTPSPGALGLAVKAAARPEGVWLDSVETERIRGAEVTSWSEGDRTSLLKLLAAGPRGRAAWGLLEELGWLDAAFPEWSVVAGLPQLAPFHEHPVDAHLWRTVDEIRRVGDDGDELTAEIVAEVGSTEDLMLAAFFHDIGKGHGGDHAEVGAGIAHQVVTRWGFGPATTAVVCAAVRHHLLLGETATRRDLDDAAVIADVADRVGDLRTLQVLYLLAIADARATGATMWTPWKASLLRSLYVRVAAVLGTGAPPVMARIDAVLEATDGLFPSRVVEEHLAAMGPDYLRGNPPEDVVWHLDVLARGPQAVALDVLGGGAIDRVLVIGRDRRGFLGAVVTVFAADGVSVHTAKLFTRADGTAIDVFEVADDRGGGALPSERWDRIEQDLHDAVAGERDLTAAVARRAAAYDRPAGAVVPVEVRCSADAAGRRTIVEVRCADRIGRLAEVVAALYGLGLDISLAKLDTRAGRVRDTFYVRREGHPVDEAEWATLAEQLRGALHEV